PPRQAPDAAAAARLQRSRRRRRARVREPPLRYDRRERDAQVARSRVNHWRSLPASSGTHFALIRVNATSSTGVQFNSINAEETRMDRKRNGRNGGEGNREADRRYREGVRRTVDDTSEEERSEQARDLGAEE